MIDNLFKAFLFIHPSIHSLMPQTFIEYQCVPPCSRHVYVGINKIDKNSFPQEANPLGGKNPNKEHKWPKWQYMK